MRRPEDSLQISAVQYLRMNGIFCAHVKNQGKWSPQYGAKLNRMGRVAGMPDLLCLTDQSEKLRRGVFMIEFKKPPHRLKSGALSKAKPRFEPDQTATIAELAGRDVPVLIIRDLAALETALRGLGIPLKGRSL
jgi:hypothetical protein